MTKLAKLRTRAFFAQQCRCIYCALPIWEPAFRDRLGQSLGIPDAVLDNLRSTAEHLVAQQDDGPNCAINIAAACLWCNRKRHAHRHGCAPDPVTYQREVRRKMKAGLWHPAARWAGRA